MEVIAVIVHLCLSNGECIDRVVTDRATPAQCGGAFAMMALPDWLRRNGYLDRGYTLKSWSCVAGTKREGIDL